MQMVKDCQRGEVPSEMMEKHAERLEALQELAPTEADYLPWNWNELGKVPMSTEGAYGESLFGVSNGRVGFVTFSSTASVVGLLHKDKWSFLPQDELYRSVLGEDDRLGVGEESRSERKFESLVGGA